mmetsp:Transcript_1078/g.2333  ORF Transcript_1078/g.2333 Transcript_1078/m.2333 type:complete len:234 (-) Transcript_1078:22-723(-)
MAHCTNHQAWVESVNQEQTREHTRLSARISDEDHERCHMVNPYVGGSPFFARGLSHMFHNNSAKTRLLLSPHSEEPLTSRRHHANILASRSHDPERVPVLLPAAEKSLGAAAEGEQGGDFHRGSVTFREPPSFASSLGGSSAFDSLPSGRAALPNSARGNFVGAATLRPAAHGPRRRLPQHQGIGAPRSSSLLAPRAPARDFRSSGPVASALASPREAAPRRAVYGKMVMPVG